MWHCRWYNNKRSTTNLSWVAMTFRKKNEANNWKFTHWHTQDTHLSTKLVGRCHHKFIRSALVLKKRRSWRKRFQGKMNAAHVKIHETASVLWKRNVTDTVARLISLAVWRVGYWVLLSYRVEGAPLALCLFNKHLLLLFALD